MSNTKTSKQLKTVELECREEDCKYHREPYGCSCENPIERFVERKMKMNNTETPQLKTVELECWEFRCKYHRELYGCSCENPDIWVQVITMKEGAVDCTSYEKKKKK